MNKIINTISLYIAIFVMVTLAMFKEVTDDE